MKKFMTENPRGKFDHCGLNRVGQCLPLWFMWEIISRTLTKRKMVLNGYGVHFAKYEGHINCQNYDKLHFMLHSYENLYDGENNLKKAKC